MRNYFEINYEFTGGIMMIYYFLKYFYFALLS